MRQKWRMLALLLLVAAALAGCSSGAQGDAAGSDAAWEPEAAVESTALDERPAGQERKLVYTASLEMNVGDFSAASAQLQTEVERLGGYLEDAQTWDGSRGEFTARVPAARYREALQALTQLGEVTGSSQSADDVTENTRDLQAELDALTVQQERLLALMEQAQSVDDLIALEQELTRVRAEINERTAALRRYDGRIDYATLHVQLEQTPLLEPGQGGETGFGRRLKNTFAQSWRFTLDFGQGVLLALAAVSPFLLVYGGGTALVVLLIVWLARRRRRPASPSNDPAKK